MSQQYFTAVFKVRDKEKFKELSSQITGAMAGGEMFGAEVTGCGWGDSMTESDRMREFLDSSGYDGQAIAEGFEQ